MGSKLRRLRAKAGVTGKAHQKRQREEARQKGRVRVVGSASGRVGLDVAVDAAGKLEPETKAGVEAAFAEAVASTAIASGFISKAEAERRLGLENPVAAEPVVVGAEPRPPAAGMRIARSSGRSRILPLLAFAMMMAGLAVPPKEER